MTALTLASGLDNRLSAMDSGLAEGVQDRTRPSKNRLQFDLPPRSMERLDASRLKTEASSNAEVVKHARRLSAALVEETERGKQFLVRAANGQLRPYRQFL